MQTHPVVYELTKGSRVFNSISPPLENAKSVFGGTVKVGIAITLVSFPKILIERKLNKLHDCAELMNPYFTRQRCIDWQGVSIAEPDLRSLAPHDYLDPCDRLHLLEHLVINLAQEMAILPLDHLEAKQTKIDGVTYLVWNNAFDARFPELLCYVWRKLDEAIKHGRFPSYEETRRRFDLDIEVIKEGENIIYLPSAGRGCA